MDWSIFFQGIMAIGIIAFSIGQFVTGKKEVKIADVDNANSTVRLFKDRADLLEKDLRILRNEFEAYKKETLIKEESNKKTIIQQEDLIKTYGAILQNRNPELENTLKEIRDYLKLLKDANIHEKQN